MRLICLRVRETETQSYSEYPVDLVSASLWPAALKPAKTVRNKIPELNMPTDSSVTTEKGSFLIYKKIH